MTSRSPFGFRLYPILAVELALTACGGSSSDTSAPPPPPPSPVSYIGTTGPFAAAADPGTEANVLLVAGTAGKRQILRGTVDFLTGTDLGQPAGLQIYKAGDGHIYGIDMTSVSAPVPVQVSSESGATVDDACTFGGPALPSRGVDYTGVYAAADYANAPNYAYFYRLPGLDGVCNTADDVIHLVHPSMQAGDSPLVAAAMPAATIYDPTTQAIAGFIAKSGVNIVALDAHGGNPQVLMTAGAPIQVLQALPASLANGLPQGGLFVLDGDIVHVNFQNGNVSGSLFTIPNWTPQTSLSAAASPTTLYFSVVIPGTGGSLPTSTLYSLPLDGSAAAAPIDTETGSASNLSFPVQSGQLFFAVYDWTAPSFTIKALSAAGGAPNTLTTVAMNSGRFIATASSIYYTSFQVTGNATVGWTRSNILSGIVGIDGTVFVPPTAASEFMFGGQQTPQPDGSPVWTPEPLAAVLRVRNLSTSVTVLGTAGVTTTTPGLAGGLVEVIDTGSNQVTASLGTMPAGSATYLNDTFRVLSGVGYVETTNDASTLNTGTRDLYLIDTGANNSLARLTGNL